MVIHRYAAIVIVASLAMVLLTLTGCGHASDYYVVRGNALFAEGKYGDAAITYRKAIQKAPESGEAHYRLALAQLAIGYTNDAYQELSRASELLPSRDDIKVEQANVGLAFYVSDPRRPQNLYARLAAIAQQLLAKDPNSYDGLRLQGHLAKTDGKLQEAEDYFRRANAVKPLQPNVVVPLVETLFQVKQFSDGERLAQELIQSQKSFLLAYDILYTHYLAQNRLAEAETLLKAKVKNNPKDANSVFQLGFHYARLRNETEMRTAVRRILDNPRDFPEGHLQTGEFFATLKNWDEALREFRAGLASAPKSRIVYLKKIASVFIAQGQREAAIQSLEQVLKEQPKERDARTMRALLLLDSNQREKLRLAEAELRDLLQQNGSDAILQYSLGRVQVATGNLEEARKHLQEAIKLRRDYIGPRVELAKIGETTGDYDQILRAANEILAIDPKNAQARLFRVTGLMGTGNNEQARAELTRLWREYPQAPGVQLQVGLLDLAEKKFDEAEVLFRKLYRPGQNDSRPLEGLVRTAIARNEHDKALMLLTEEVKRTPDSKPIRSLMAATAAKIQKPDLAIEQYRWLAAQEPKNFDLQIRLAEAYQAKGDVENAISAFRRASELAPKDARVPTAVAFLQAANGRPAEAKANYQRALQLDPENPLVMNNLAFLLADTGENLEEATQMAERAQRKDPTNPTVADTLGWVYLKRNMNDGAVQIFSNLVRRYPDSPSYRYHLAAALLQQGDKGKAKTELETALSQTPPKDVAEKIKQLIAKIS